MAEEIAITTAAGLASNATESGYDLLKQQISYMFKYQSYINDLKKQVEDLRNKRETVEKPVESAERQGEEIYKAVKKWLSDVDEFTERVEKAIIEDEDKANKGGCFKLGSCPNLIQRYKLGKQAMKAKIDGADLLGKGNFSSVSYRPALQRTESMYVRDYETFDSREQAFQEIMEALQDVNVNMIGVYGMGGVGKTTLVKKVAWEAKKNKLFDEVVIAEATQTPDYKKIQEKVAYELGLEFRQEGEYQRTDLLREKIKKQKNLLIILDNIWTKLDLDKIGIPFGGVGREKDEKIRPCTKVDLDAIGIPLGDVEREKDEKIRPCTILLTSRNRDLLSKDMKTQKDIFIGPLSNGDAWNMFCKIVGDAAESSDFRPVADEIVKKCDGLPVAISLIANALKNESLHAWDDALAQLKKSNPRHILGMNETLYSMTKLSYEFLKNEEAKSLFLLCALHNAGDSVFIDDLLKYSMGWNLFEVVYTLEEGRNRLHRLIDHLKASCLLEDGTYDNSVKMHDIIHAVAVSIASAEKLMFNIQNFTDLKEVLGERISKDSTAISLPYRNINDDLPERLEYPKLKLFFLFGKNRSPQIADAFFEKMKELRVLSVHGLRFLPLPSSISFLKNLQTLFLKSCILGDIRILGELSKLAILSLVESNIEELPAEIGQLTRLKLLDLSNCLSLKYIATNVISSLSQLEELYMGNSFVEWEVEGVDNQGRRNASLEELKRLSNLTTLHLHIQDARVMPQDLFFKKLKSYKIFIGDEWKWSIKFDLSTSRMLKLKIDDSIHLQHGVKSLLKMTEDLSLEGMSGVRNVIYELSVDGFPQLKHLCVKNDLELLYIINSVAWKLVFPNLESLILRNLIKLENICHGQLNAGSFRKLRIIKIEKCDRLKYLFAFFMAKNLVQLQEIEVSDCKDLKEIFGEENNDHGDEIETNNQTELNQLCSLALQRLPKFITIGSDMRVVVPRLENLKVCSINFENTCIHQPLAMFHYSQCLKSLTVEDCNGLKFLLSSSMVKSLNQLQKLLISNCKSMEVIIDSEGVQKEEKIVDMSFPKLLYMKLEVLPKLTSFGTGNLIEFPFLKELHIEHCPNLKAFFCKSFYPEIEGKPKEEVNSENDFININPLFDEKVAFPSLEKMVLLHLDSLHLIWHNQTLQVDSFCKLKVVRVEYCKKLLTIVPSNSQGHLTFHNLEILEVRNCWSMKSLFPVSTATGLVQLKKLWISSCGLEKIVSEGEVNGAPIFLFPQLTRIHLENLRELKCFYPRLHAVDWPMLSSLGVYKCKNINLYASEFPSFQAREAERQPALFLLEKVIPNLEVVGLDAYAFKLAFLLTDGAESFTQLKILRLCNFDDESIASLLNFLQKLSCLESLDFSGSSFKELFPYEQGHIWKQDFQLRGNTFLQNLQVCRCHCLTILIPSATSFNNLKSLEICNCNGLAKVLTSEATKTLINLTTMRIRECKLLTEVIANDGDREEEIVFGKLEVLELYCLSSLTFFCSANYSFQFPCLEQVIVSQCPKLNIFSEGVLNTPLLKKVQLTESNNDKKYFWKDDLNSTVQQIFMDMIGFRNIEYFKFSEFPPLKEKIWSGGFPVSLFCNLKWLVLDEVFDLSSAFPSHVFYNLRNLETLEVRNHHSLKDLFDIKGKTLKNSKEEILGFNNLKSLKVHNCSSLRYMLTPSIILGLHQLKEIEVKNCALIEEIITEDEGKKGAIDKIFIPHLNSIVLELLPDLTNFYSGTNYLECPSLKSITIANCPKIETFVFSDLKTDYFDHNASLFSEKVAFPSLEKMVLLHLDNLQLIWHNQKLHVESFCKLKVVRVEFCEKLLTIVPSNTQGRLTFYNLESLKVKNCWSLKSLLPVSIAIGLLRLKDLWINSCGLEKIVSEEEVNGAPTFLFPQLTNIHLDNLRELKCFYPRLHTIEWPMLRSLNVYKCNKIKVYAAEFPSFQARDGESQPALFLLEKVIPNLEVLGLDAHDFSSTFLHSDLAESFGQLKILNLGNFDDESIASLFNFLQKLNFLESFGFYGNSFKELFLYEQGFQGNTFLPNLQRLQVYRCHYMTILMSSATSFKNLKTLVVCNCDGLALVLTSEAVKTLINLTTMRIRECKLLTEVIANDGDREDEIVFGKLKVLELYCLSSLTFFCSANYSFEFPCLEQVIVSQCPKLNIFSEGVLTTPLLKKVQLTKSNNDGEYFWTDDLNSTVQQIFTDMIGFRNIEYFKFSEFPTLKEKIWSGGFQVGLFCNLKWLVLDEVFDLSSAFPSHVFYNLRNLETLEVRNHHSLKDLFDMKGKTLKNSKEEILGFNNLKSLKVHNCSSLRYMLTPSIISGLHQLKEIEVKNCALIEEIITEDEGKKGAIDKIFIPHLKSIVIELLPDLTNFCSGTNYLGCPSLESITIVNCPKMKTFVFTDLKDHFDHNAPLFSEKVAFPSLEKMVLLHLGNLQLIWHNQRLHVESFCRLKVVKVEFCEKLLSIVPSNNQGHLTFHNLESLNVKNCWSMKSLFPVSIATGLVQLKELQIYSCGLEKIVSGEEVNKASTFLFPRLTHIHLEHLPELKCFYPQLHAIEWPMLRRLGVYKCKKIKLYAPEFPSLQARDRERQPAPFLLEKVIPNLEVVGLDALAFKLAFLLTHLAESFAQLKILWLRNFDDESIASLFDFLEKLNCLESLGFSGSSFKELFPYEQGHIWKQDFQGNTFLQNLQKLQVRRCHGLTILMSSATSFSNLKTLEVYNCNGLAKVLTSEAIKTLVNLTTMRIRECKLLTEIIADEGKREEEIVLGELKILELYSLSSLAFFCSANCSFQFPCLEQVIVSQCPKLSIFSRRVLHTPLLKKVQLMEQDGHQKYFWKEDLNSTIKQMFSDMVGFRNFEHLTLSEFPNMKENIWNDQLPIDIFWNLKSLVVDKFSNIASGIPSNVLCQFKNLEMLEVKSCESLEQVFDLEVNHQEILGIKKFRSLKIDNCNSLRYIFTPSVLLGLVQLQEIEVKNCALIEEIIKNEGEKDVGSDKIIIPLLNSIMFESLPNLTSFYSGSKILEFPPLQTIIVKDCQKIYMKEHSIHLSSLFTVKVVLPSLETSSYFHNLTILVIDGFDHLQYLFPSSMVSSLIKLRELEISNCMLMERVIDEDEGRTEMMLFPKLYQLKLRDLPQLTTFCNSTANSVEMSSLFRLWIDNCPGIETFISSYVYGDMTLSSKEPEGMSAKENSTHVPSLFDQKVRLPSLERLRISHADQLVKLWNNQVSMDSFNKLNRLFLRFCKNLASVFPSNMLGKHQKLEFLEVQNCDSVEEIFEVLEKRSSMMEEIFAKGEAVPRFVFSKLAHLSLEMLPSLKSFYPDMHISEWPILEDLKVYGCNNVEILASELLSIPGSHGDSQQPLFFIYKDAFPSLEKLELCGMPRLKHLWRGNFQPCNAFQNLQTLKVSECDSLENSWCSSLTFRNLTTLQVSKCDGLRYLLTPSKTKTLGQLTRMNVSDCKQMEEIITHLGDEVMENSIVFSKLGCLELHCLSSLKSFCCGDYSLEFLSLKKVIVRQCLEMETFCHGILSTPKLERLQLTEGEDEVEECWEGNLNSTIQYLYNNTKVWSSKED
ncbi:uncharacterized protein LOC123210160 isoform X4 [Mangifera indica]|uniref:uncharacterized protein LOC123210160 isoform X4 n=1 Tax=Mangifera indica TaxID=29780 RepID=UPI001CF97686|nr:uncharacterized protein LOC123210160 isoform X4 [Mangifera indica]